MTPYDLTNTLSAYTLFLAIVGLLILLVTPKTERFHRTRVIGIAFFSVGLGGTAMFFCSTILMSWKTYRRTLLLRS